MRKLNFKYFLSDADEEQYKKYQSGLAKALEKFSVEGVILTTIEKQGKENTFVICAHSSNHLTIAGIRLEIRSKNNKLPLEKCEVAQKNLILNRINYFSKDGKTIGELSGLWVSPEFKGASLGRRLVLEATELGLGLGLSTLIAMPPQHTLKYFTGLGFVADGEIPQLAYPDDRYISTVLVYLNPKSEQNILSEKIKLPQIEIN